jgi:hypothetical protein
MMFTDADFSCPADVDRSVIQVKDRPFRVWPSSGWELLLFKWCKDICREVVTIHCCASREFIDNMDNVDSTAL